MSEFMEVIDDYVYPIISYISAILAALVVLIMIILSLYDFSLVNRVSLRLQAAISAIDVWTHTTALWFIYYTEPGFMCTFIAWQRFFGPLLYLFFNVSIAFNLQYIFLMGKKVTTRVEVLYWVIPIVAGLIITIPILASGALGYSKYNGCYLVEQSKVMDQIVEIFGSMLWNVLTLLYCSIIIIAVAVNLNRNVRKIKYTRRFNNRGEFQKAVNKSNMLINRILLYPLIAIISTTGVLISQIYYYNSSEPHEGLDTWANVSLALTGTLNFLAFIIDPTFHSAIQTIYKRIRGTISPKQTFITNSNDLSGSLPLTSTEAINSIGLNANDDKFETSKSSSYGTLSIDIEKL